MDVVNTPGVVYTYTRASVPLAYCERGNVMIPPPLPVCIKKHYALRYCTRVPRLHQMFGYQGIGKTLLIRVYTRDRNAAELDDVDESRRSNDDDHR